MQHLEWLTIYKACNQVYGKTGTEIRRSDLRLHKGVVKLAPSFFSFSASDEVSHPYRTTSRVTDFISQSIFLSKIE